MKVGRSARYYLRSLFIGITGLVDICTADRFVANSNLNGHVRATEAVRRYMFAAAFGAIPAEALQLELLKYDNLLRRVPELRSLLDDQLEYVSALPDIVWRRCADMVFQGDSSATELRDLALGSALTCAGAYTDYSPSLT